MLVRVNLFDPWRRPIYGTATAQDIFQVCLGALLFCAVAGGVTWGITNVLIVLK
jgi:hypothetical protein